ncbi:MAG: hypothetical protein WAK11_07350, partial [Candidatus Cybelea sp.]
AKNWLTRVRMEVGRRSREGREQENNDGRHVGLDKKPSLMEVSRSEIHRAHQTLNAAWWDSLRQISFVHEATPDQLISDRSTSRGAVWFRYR